MYRSDVVGSLLRPAYLKEARQRHEASELTDAAFKRMVLHEGSALRAFDGAELLAKEKVTPYDAFAVWMHLYRREGR